MKAREASVQRLFSRLAPYYGLLNSVLSFGLHHLWRRFALAKVPTIPNGLHLDLCAGTGDFALAMRQRGVTVVAADLSAPMLQAARRRSGGTLPAVVANAFDLPFPPAAFATATIGFGLRHSEDELPAFMAEVRRVMRSGATLVVLELSHPPNRLWRWLSGLYIHYALPLIGAFVDREAYRYLSNSLNGYPNAPQLAALITEAGFSHCEYHWLTWGIAAVHVATA